MPKGFFSNVLALLSASVLVLQPQAGSAGAAEVFPTIKLSAEGLSGERAVKALGRNLSAVSRFYGIAPKDLQSLMLRDHTLKLARNGRLYYAEDPAQAPTGPAPAESILTGAPFPLDQTFKLHSRPGAKRFLVLNFQGATITGTYWNTSLNRPTIVATPFDTDGNPGLFSDAERRAIQFIWQRVAEDYAAFDVDVTTEVGMPGIGAGNSATALITRYSSYNTCGCPGIAFTSTFGNPTYEPTFVGYDKLGSSEKNIAEAVSHELGHRLGLDHDGTLTSPYYGGHGSGSTSWAPIMGNSYASTITQFSKGEYPNANNPQDDIAIMTRFLPLVADAGSDLSESEAFPGTSANGVTSGSVSGVIQARGDADVFTIAAGVGRLTASLTPAARGPNADLTISLLDGAGTVLASANAPNALDAALNFQVSRPGTYYLRVGATGRGNPLAGGYSDYGSLGHYRLTASFPASLNKAPRAVISAATASGPAPLQVRLSAAGSTDDGRITAYLWDFGNGTTTNTSGAQAVTPTFSKPGQYKVSLRVVDDGGFSNVTSQLIDVGETFWAGTLSITPAATAAGRNATAIVNNFVDERGNRLSVTEVTASWSGTTQGSATARVTRSGARFVSNTSANQSACFTITVNKVTATNPVSRKPEIYYPRAPLSATTCPQQAAR